MTRAAAVLLLALAGCWSAATGGGGATHDEEPIGPPPAIVVPRPMFKAARPRGPYADLAGAWTGHGMQYDNNEDWDIDLTFSTDNAAIGDDIGKVDYPGLACGGVLVRRAEHPDGTLVASEKITYGTRCIDGGTFRFPAHPTNRSLDWKWFGPDTGAEEAQGAVHRR